MNATDWRRRQATLGGDDGRRIESASPLRSRSDQKKGFADDQGRTSLGEPRAARWRGVSFPRGPQTVAAPLPLVCSRLREHLHRSLPQSYSGFVSVDELDARPFQDVLDRVEIDAPEHQYSRLARLKVDHRGHSEGIDCNPKRAATIVYLLAGALAWEVMPSRASVDSSGCPVWGRASSA